MWIGALYDQKNHLGQQNYPWNIAPFQQNNVLLPDYHAWMPIQSTTTPLPILIQPSTYQITGPTLLPMRSSPMATNQIVYPTFLPLRSSLPMATNQITPPTLSPTMAQYQPPTIKSVWSHNLKDEFAVITAAIKKHTYVTVDTEFPSTTQSYPDNKRFNCRSPDERYAHLKANVDISNFTHLGFTLSDSYGNIAENCVWQFNFQPLDEQRRSRQFYAKDALRTQGFDLDNDKPQPIQYSEFTELLWSSGLICNSKITWLAFSGSFDLGYLTKLLVGSQSLPGKIDEFVELIKNIFGANIFDLKYLMPFCGLYHGLSLENLAANINVRREVGHPHEAGSDSLLTWKIFQKLRVKLQSGWENKYSCFIAGLHVP